MFSSLGTAFASQADNHSRSNQLFALHAARSTQACQHTEPMAYAKVWRKDEAYISTLRQSYRTI